METNSKPDSSSRTGLIKRLLRWLFWIAGAVALFIAGYLWVLRFVLGHRFSMPSPGERICFALINLLAVIFLVTLLLPLIRWAFSHMKWVGRCWAALFTWRTARRALIGLAILATLLAVFYTVENWRGKRAWEQCKRNLAAKGELLDWKNCIPAPIPDAENIIKAPKMAEWFVKQKWTNWQINLADGRWNSAALVKSINHNDPKTPILIADVIVVPANTASTTNGNVVIRFDAPGGRELLGTFVRDSVGPSLTGAQGWVLVRHSLNDLKPGKAVLQTDRVISAGDLARALPADLLPSGIGPLRVEADARQGAYRILLVTKPTLSAEEYLAWSGQFASEFDLIRAALKRPHLRMDDDYQRPFEIPTVNFVNIRNVAQSAAQRAQCCLLLGRSEQACHELSLIPELRRLLAAKPTTLVSAMIDVAVSGLYANTVAQGFRLQAWREPELITLQEQLRQIDLPSRAVDSFRVEGAAACRTFETASARQIRELYSFGNSRILRVADWEKFTNPRFLLVQFAPRGWVFQNLATAALAKQAAIEAYDVEHQIIQPGVLESATRQVERIPHSPYAILASAALPNYVRATRTTARNQTLVNQALIVCGLERYRLAHGSYPEALDVLVPEFVEKMPPDIIGGQPLKYRRTGDSQFLLYSIGWNEQDDGGVPGKDAETGDWVWTTKSQ